MDTASPLLRWWLEVRWMRCVHEDAMARLDAVIVALGVTAALLLV